MTVKGKLIFLYEHCLINGLGVKHGAAVVLSLSGLEFIKLIDALGRGGAACGGKMGIMDCIGKNGDPVVAHNICQRFFRDCLHGSLIKGRFL